MLVEPTIEELLTKLDNRYILTMLCSKRARQLTDGGKPLVEIESKNVVSQAAAELAEGKLAFVRGNVKVDYPMKQEIEEEELSKFKEGVGKSKSSSKKDDNDEIVESNVMDYSANHAADISDIKEQEERGLQYTKQFMNILSLDNDSKDLFEESLEDDLDEFLEQEAAEAEEEFEDEEEKK